MENSFVNQPSSIPLRRRRSASTAARATKVSDATRVKRLIWLYFFFLIFEGALRKWVVPSLAQPLLIIRDPIVLAIYFYAWKAGKFPQNLFMTSLGIITFLSFAISVLAPYGSLSTTLYGIHANFLHLPLIFIMGKVLEGEDLRQYTKWILILGIPLALLMLLQFLSPPGATINSGINGDFEQLGGVGSHIRPPATFSFATGPSFYFAVLAAFLLNMQFVRGKERQPWLLLLLSSLALVLTIPVSLSRALIANIALVATLAFIATVFFQPRLIARWLWCFGIGGCLLFTTSGVSTMREGTDILVERAQGASNGAPVGSDMTDRMTEQFQRSWNTFFVAPLCGYGLGLGTNGGAALAGSSNTPFITQEGEWARIILESGPILGGAFILWRICFTLWLGWLALYNAARGNVLPALLFGIGGQLLFMGMLSQPTVLGFAAFIAGLELAASKRQRENASKPTGARRPIANASRPPLENQGVGALGAG